MNQKGNQYLIEKDKTYYLPTFKRFPVALLRGEGSRVWDADGKEYLDALAGIAVNNLGHCHPAVTGAIAAQARTLMHCSNFFVNEPQANLSELLCEASGLHSAFITNSGAESVETAIKIARKYGSVKGRGGRIIAFKRAFHGRTMATIAMGKKAMQKGFAPIPRGFSVLPWENIPALKDAINKKVCGIIIEPVQGEGGVRPARFQFVRKLREICDEHDIALIFDEVQCGIGRTGKLFAKDHYEIQPDIMALAKGLGGGMPVGAVLSNKKTSEAIDFGDHGTTFGGNPLACAAALATLDIINQKDFLNEVKRKGEWLRAALQERIGESAKEIRGLGLMIGVELIPDAKEVVMDMLKNGVIANATTGNTLRLVPPLNISDEDLEKLVEVIEKSVKAVYGVSQEA